MHSLTTLLNNIKKDKFKAILSISFILISLYSYYSFRLNVPIAPVSGFFIMVTALLYRYRMRIFDLEVSQGSLIVACFFIFLMAWSSLGLVFLNEFPLLKRLLAFAVSITAAITAGFLFNIISMRKLFSLYIAFHTTFFLIQFVTYYGTGYVVDFLWPIIGQQQRMFGGSFTLPYINRFGRMAGLFNEPGTYCTFVAPATAILLRWYKDSLQTRFLCWISIATLFLSFSFYGACFGVVILFFSDIIPKKLRVFVAILVAIPLTPYLLYRFVYRPSLGHGTGLGIREAYLNNSLEFLTADWFNFFFGANLLTTDPRAPLGMATNDIGLLGYLNHFSGTPVLFLILFALFTASQKTDQFGKITLLLLFISKMSIFSVFFGFIFVAALTAR